MKLRCRGIRVTERLSTLEFFTIFYRKYWLPTEYGKKTHSCFRFMNILRETIIYLFLNFVHGLRGGGGTKVYINIVAGTIELNTKFVQM